MPLTSTVLLLRNFVLPTPYSSRPHLDSTPPLAPLTPHGHMLAKIAMLTSVASPFLFNLTDAGWHFTNGIHYIRNPFYMIANTFAVQRGLPGLGVLFSRLGRGANDGLKIPLLDLSCHFLCGQLLHIKRSPRCWVYWIE